MSFGSAAASSASTSAAFSHLNFLRCSATSSLSLRMSTWGFFAIRVFLTLTGGTVSIAPPVLGPSPALPAAAGPPTGRRGPMAMPPRGKRDLLSPLAGLRLLPRLCPEHLHFRARQLPQLAGAHPGDADPTVIGPMELLDRRPHRLHQPLDQVRPAFGDHHAHPGILRGTRMHLRLQRAGAAVLQTHPRPQPLELSRSGHAVHLRQIGPPHPEAGVHDRERESAVVGDDQGALDVVVQPPDRVDALRDVLEIRLDGRPVLRIAQGGDAARRLVENVVDLVLRLADGAAVHLDEILLDVRFAAELADHLPVDADVPGLDQLLRLASRGDAGVGEDLLQPFGAHHSAFAGSGGAGGASTVAVLFADSSARSMALSSCASALSLSAVAWTIRSSTTGSAASSESPAATGVSASPSTIRRDSSESSWNSRSVGSCVRSRRLNSSRNSFVVP